MCSSYILAGFIRPVVIFGAIADIARERLKSTFPDKFEFPRKCLYSLTSAPRFKIMEVFKILMLLCSNVLSALLNKTFPSIHPFNHVKMC